MFSKPVTMLLGALIGLAGLHIVAAAPPSCPSGKADYCCVNPNAQKFTVNCHPFKDEVTCLQSGGIRASCEHTADGGMECGLPQ